MTALPRKTPETVFTPRNHEVNTAMYVSRKHLEREFSSAVQRNMNLMLHGESGCGKTWLYKQFFATRGIYYEILNLGAAVRHRSIEAELRLRFDEGRTIVQTGQADEMEAKANIIAFTGGTKTRKDYKVPEKDWYLATLARISEAASGSPAYLVLDNLESAARKPEIVEEIANLILLIDDARYAKFNVKLLLVGVPTSARDFFSNIEDGAPISNRILELPEVSRLDGDECATLVRKGFIRELRYVVPDHTVYQVSSKASWITDGIPQRLHEYCLQLARISFERRFIYVGATNEPADDLAEAQIEWARESLSSDYVTIENCVARAQESRERRLQLLYCIGQLTSREFTLADLREELKRHFPIRVPNPDRARIEQHANDLLTSPHQILKMNIRRDRYVLFEPRHKLMLRAIIMRDPKTELVELKKLNGGSIAG